MTTDNPTAVTLPDEDALRLPEDWLTKIFPRRDGVPGPPITLDSTAVEVVARHEQKIHEVVQQMGGDPTLAEAARAHLRGEVTPLSAAVIATIAAEEAHWEQWDEIPLFADAWIATRGLRFAAEATAELARVYDHKSLDRTRYNYLRFRASDDDDWGIGTNEDIAGRVRAFLAVADEPDYRDAVEALAAHRTTDFQRTVVSFLVPTETDWVDEICLAASTTDLYQVQWRLLLSSVGSPRQLDLLRTRKRAWSWLSREELLGSLLAAVGTELLPELAGLVDETYVHPRFGLAALPSDEALTLLVSKLDQSRTHPAVRHAMRNFPVRALRVLAKASTRTSTAATYAARLLRAHLRDNPELVAAALPTLPPEIRSAVDGVEARLGWVPEADVEKLPDLLAAPPWARGRKPARRTVVKDLVAPVPADAAQGDDPLLAARALIPDALGKPDARQRSAETGLRRIAEHTPVADIVAAARGDHGDKAAKAVATLLNNDPLDFFPAQGKLPDVTGQLDLDVLPQVLLRDQTGALPRAAVVHLVTMLALSKSDHLYPGVAVAKGHLDPASLAELGWTLFEWTGREGWALHALAAIGDDTTARRLAPIIRDWPGEGGLAKAKAGVSVLAAIGTDTALLYLHDIASKPPSKSLGTAARDQLAQIAAARGLSVDELADQLVPDFGLDARGSLTLDYGPRQFTVGFDEQLKPYVADADGTRRKDLPKPGVRDDQDLAPAAHQRFAALKKDVRTVADAQIRRFEQAMVSQRRWTVAEFRRLFVAHPLLWHLVRRLVWTAVLEDTSAGQSFRVAEDRTFADVDDTTLTLPDTAMVGIAHPLHLGDSRPDWAQVFDDYQVSQPFPQLDRAVHALTDEERASTALARFHDTTVSTYRLVGLAKRGWRRAAIKESGMESWISRPVPDGRFVVVGLDPGVYAGDVSYYPEQRITDVWIDSGPEGLWGSDVTTTFAALDPVTASEVLRELTELTG